MDSKFVSLETQNFAEQFEGQRRQDLPKMYLRDGSIYLTRTDVIMIQNSLKGKVCMAWMIEADRACSIDVPFDWFMAEQLLKYHKVV